MRRWLLVGLTVALAGATAAAEPPRRIVAAGSAMTEIVHALGEGDRLVGVDTTSLYPPDVRRLPQIGYLRALAAEGILSLTPDLLLVTDEAGPPPVIDQVEAAGVAVLRTTAGYSAKALMARIDAVSTAIGRRDRGEAMAAAIADDLEALTRALADLHRRPRVLFLLSVSQGGLLAAGRDTAAAAMISLAGGVNAIDGYRGYKPLSAEIALAAAPEILLATQQTVVALGGADGMLTLPQLAFLARTGEPHLVVLDAAYMLAFGPRTVHAARDLAAAFHPDRAIAPLPARAWVATDAER